MINENKKERNNFMSARERNFTTELKKSFESDGAFFHKLADLPHFQNSGMRFDLKKPFDCFGIYKNFSFAIECKVIGRQSFSYKPIRQNQINGLVAFHRASASGGQRAGNAFVFVNQRYVIPHRVNRIFILPIYEVLADMSVGIDSITLKEQDTIKFTVNGEKGFYDPKKILECMRKADA